MREARQFRCVIGNSFFRSVVEISENLVEKTGLLVQLLPLGRKNSEVGSNPSKVGTIPEQVGRIKHPIGRITHQCPLPAPLITVNAECGSSFLGKKYKKSRRALRDFFIVIYQPAIQSSFLSAQYFPVSACTSEFFRKQSSDIPRRM